MTTMDTHAGTTITGRVASSNGVAAVLQGVAAWVTTTDHKRIGRLFIGLAAAGCLIALTIASLLGFERISADGYVLFGADNFAQFFSFFRAELIFGVVLPMLLGVAIAIVPLQVGAKSISFARGAMFGLWSWLAGIAMVEISYLGNGGPGGGDSTMVDLFLLGMILLAVGLISASASVIVTVLNSRCSGMTLGKAPIFAWSALIGASALVFTLPVLIGNLIYNYADHSHGRVAFGGNVGVNEWISWSFSQPQTYVFVLPILGVLAELVAVTAKSRHALRGVILTGIGLAATSVIGGVTQTQQTLDWTGSAGDKIRDLVPWAIFNVLPIVGVLVVLGASLFIFTTHPPRIVTPFVPALLGVGMVVTGMVGHAISTISRANLATTVFEEAEFIYVMYGGLLGIMAAVAYWGPKWWGRKLPDKAVMGTATIAFLGTVLAALPYYVAGFADQPAATAAGFSYSGPQEIWNTLSTIGHVLVLIAVIQFIVVAFVAFRAGEVAGDDPWDGQTLEWTTSSPAPTNNFTEVPVVTSSEPLLDRKSTGGAS